MPQKKETGRCFIMDWYIIGYSKIQESTKLTFNASLLTKLEDLKSKIYRTKYRESPKSERNVLLSASSVINIYETKRLQDTEQIKQILIYKIFKILIEIFSGQFCKFDRTLSDVFFTKTVYPATLQCLSTYRCLSSTKKRL